MQAELTALDKEMLDAIAREVGLSDADLQAAAKDAEDHLEKGIGYRTNRMYDDAVRELAEASALAPFRVDIQRELAKAHLKRWQEDGAPVDKANAERLLKACVDTDPKNEEHYRLLRQLRERRSGTWRWVGLGLAAASLVVIVQMVNPGSSHEEIQSAEPVTRETTRTAPTETTPSETTPTETAPATGAPTITSVTPTLGPEGQWVYLHGTNFVTGETTVAMGGIEGIQANTYEENTACGFTVPGGATGTTNIVVTTPNGSTTSADKYTVGFPTTAPNILSISPNSGPPGQNLYVHGTGFANGATTVAYGDVEGIQATVYFPEQLAFTVPGDATESSRVTVTTALGSDTSAATFHLTPKKD